MNLVEKKREAHRAAYVEAAAGVHIELEALLPEDGFEGLHFRYTGADGRIAHLSRMIANWRIQECDARGAYTGRFWCFAGTGVDTFLMASIRLRRWDVREDAEPAGWAKAWDGRSALP